MSKGQEFELLKNNFKQVEIKFIDFFEKGEPRWQGEAHDLLRNHYKNIDNFYEGNITLEKLNLTDLPDNIKQEMRLAFEAFKKGEQYHYQ
jgi:hypothetical protein